MNEQIITKVKKWRGKQLNESVKFTFQLHSLTHVEGYFFIFHKTKLKEAMQTKTTQTKYQICNN